MQVAGLKRAFTLLELIVVVMIMGIVYIFAIGSLEKIRQKNEHLLPTLGNLKSFLLAKNFEKEARFVCFDDCTACTLLLDGEKSRNISNFFDSSPLIYRYDPTLGVQQTDPDPFFDENGVEKEVCFSYRVYKDGIGDQLFVEYHRKVYDFSDYFEDARLYDSIEDLANKKEELLQKVRS